MGMRTLGLVVLGIGLFAYVWYVNDTKTVGDIKIPEHPQAELLGT